MKKKQAKWVQQIIIFNSMKYNFSATRNLITIIFTSFILQAYTQNITVKESIPQKMGRWGLTFAEEFDGTALRSNEWFTYYPYTEDGSDSCVFCRTHGDAESQIYLDENVEVKDGKLLLIAKREDAQWMGTERKFTSGMVQSKQNFGMGYYEFRAKLPAGQGLWPALWIFGAKSTEIDFMEARMKKPKRFHISVHNWNIRQMEYKRVRSKTDLSEDFHVYAMVWDSNFLKFYFDGQEVWTLCKYTTRSGRNPRNCENAIAKRFGTQAVFPSDDERLNLLMNIAILPEVDEPVRSSAVRATFPSRMEIDYVRVYTKE